MRAQNSRPDCGKSKPFPWRQALLAAGVFAVLSMSLGWLYPAALGLAIAMQPWLLLLVGVLSAVLGFTVVVCEWLVQHVCRRLGIASVGDVFIRSDF